MRTILLGIFLSLLAATGACGKKGPLYLPEEKAQADAAAKDAANKDAAKKDAAGKSDPAPQPAPTTPPQRPEPR